MDIHGQSRLICMRDMVDIYRLQDREKNGIVKPGTTTEFSVISYSNS